MGRLAALPLGCVAVSTSMRNVVRWSLFLDVFCVERTGCWCFAFTCVLAALVIASVGCQRGDRGGAHGIAQRSFITCGSGLESAAGSGKATVFPVVPPYITRGRRKAFEDVRCETRAGKRGDR